MNIKIRNILLIIFLEFNVFSYSQIVYISPKPNSQLNNPGTNIILKFKDSFNKKSNFNITVYGNKNGFYDFDYKIKDKMLLLFPKKYFLPDEKILVKFSDTLILSNNKPVMPFSFSFDISAKITQKSVSKNKTEKIKTLKSDIPANYPEMTIIKNGETAPGEIFYYNVTALASNNDRFITIMDNDGVPVYYRQENNIGLNFDLQPSGYLSFWIGDSFVLMDSSYTIIDTIGCGNGYIANWHEFINLPNRHSILFAYDEQIVDMSRLVEGGDTNALVEGLVIQELDEEKDVIFQWRSWDHYSILDAIDVDFTNPTFSYVHGNSMELDNDGNLLLSARLLNEVTKIDMTTGDIIWRLGGKNNEFNFTNDSDMFCRQHDVRRIANGNITLFDNALCHPPSSAKEYKIDEINKTATLVWKFTKNTLVPHLGSVQRLENGNTFINWGKIENTTVAAMTEVDSLNNIVFEIYFKEYNLIYRSHRYKWSDENHYTALPDKLLLKDGYRIFPNPAKDILNIQLKERTATFSNICIYDLKGHTVLKSADKISSGELKLNISNLDEGVYFLKIDVDKKLIVEKIVISR